MRQGEVSTHKVGATGAASSGSGVNKVSKENEVETIKLVSDNAEEKAALTQAQTNATNELKASIKNGNAQYYNGILFDDVDITTGDMTLRDIEKKYNLPQGTLNKEKVNVNGYYATQKPAGGMVSVSAKTLAKSMGVKVEDLKNMFPEYQQYNWEDVANAAWKKIKSKF